MSDNSSKQTTDHETIRKWTEARGGEPAAVSGTVSSGGDAGVIRLKFSDSEANEELIVIGWDDWFKKFEESGLAFVYQEETSDGKQSSFNKLVSR